MSALYKREKNKRSIRKILIVCEGGKTEPNYFRSFPIDESLIDIRIEGTGRSADSLVEHAIELKETAEREKNPFNQVWCVFDKDSNPSHKFNRAFERAESNKIKIAYSNEAFEVWYILHFEYLVSGITKTQYIEKLSTYLNRPYQKKSENMYNELKKKQQKAIKYSKKLLSDYSNFDPANNNPSTTVHDLVEELNRFLIK